jgi:APA family basic amino acid/polyamine antiporter
MSPAAPRLHKSLSTVEYFTFGFGSMVGVGWLVLIDDWLGRGGPAGASLAFLAGGFLLMPIARTYGRLVAAIPDAGAEIAYAEGVFPRSAAFAAAWTMVLSYAIVCPWEAVAVGNLLARIFPALDALPLYSLGGKTITAPRLALGLAVTAGIALLNYRGIRGSGRFQNWTTFGLLAIFAVFVALGLAKGSPAHAEPLFPRPGAGGAWISILLTLQIVPYFLTGFESVAKGSEEARDGFDPGSFGRAISAALGSGALFYVAVIAAVSFVFPWKQIVSGHIGTEAAFARAFGSRAIADLIILAAFLSLLKVFNGNFVAATRLLFGIGRRGLVHPRISRIHPQFGTPSSAIVLLALLTAGASFLGDALLVPISEVGSLAVAVGWLSACVAYLARSRSIAARGRPAAAAGAAVSAAILVMKIWPTVPGSFTAAEWIALAGWSALGLVLAGARRDRRSAPLESPR